MIRRGPARGSGGRGGRVQRLIKILDSVLCVLDPHTESDSFGAHARAKLLFASHLPMGCGCRMAA